MIRSVLTFCITLMMGSLLASPLLAKGVYKTQEQFLIDVFARAGDVPEASAIWLNKERKAVAAQILERPYRGLRARYWRDGSRTAWVFDEIGKELPITIGVVVAAGEIEQLEILAFRESRGGEVRYPFFTRQFRGISVDDRLQLTRNIDGISGATLSVWAVQRVARLALYLHGQTDLILAQRQAEQ